MREEGKLRVLLVEDDPGDRWIISEILRSRGHAVTSCERAETGWEHYRDNPFPLALLDWILPGMDGLELCRRIRNHPAGDRTVILLVTGRDAPEDLAEVLRAGADDYISKPIDVGVMNVRLAVAEKETVDVRLRKRTQEALEAKTRELERLFANLDGVFFSLDLTSDELVQVSPGTERLLGVSPADLRFDRRLRERLLLPRKLRERLESPDRLQDHSIAHQHRVETPDGRDVWLEVSAKATADEGGLRVDGVVSDITERKVAEAQLASRNRELRTLARRLEQANEELEAFAYSVSHDLRSPLRTMEGFAHALLEDYGDELSPEARDYARRILASGKQAEALIRDLLNYSRLSFEDIELDVVDLDDVVDTALDRVESEVEAADARIEIESPLPPVRGHAAILVQVVGNLVSNAVKFVPEGRAPEVRIRSEEGEDGIRLWIEDNGIGVPSGQRERIFRVFERLAEGGNRPGTGIGLAIVRRGMERIGGAAGVECDGDRGSRFWIEIPTGPPGAEP